ncbi:metallophosphoesterase family protein [Sulfurisphaera ohwakuensis]|uniref:Metallophosphoesterase n=1 Tax=Sulfurisphaera ohwakuensis TaxID=69656 RepID=A0A650CKG5_SULOH|nr:metallophosphoesterase [Sulfurisphaera ohwakuensis]MBB5254625.1 putative phosphodiesterase [Sulfurisphaera ohwakuensis]QGR18252.1 metallophosphoesterase [Sulfurisphaera ohwakuensis]
MILLISDLHKSFDSLEEMESVKWLLSILDELKPDYLIGAGDWGEGMSIEDFSNILSRTKLIAVYGNHENFSIIKNFSIRDGQIIRVGNMRITGINGLIGDNKDYGIKPEKFLRIIGKLKDIDILVTHQPPYLPEIYPKMRYNEATELMLQALEQVRPKLHFNGHMTGGCYSYYEFEWGKYLRVDSSARFRCYAVIDKNVTVYQRGEEVFSFDL